MNAGTTTPAGAPEVWLRTGSTVYTLKQEGWRRGEPVMVNRVRIAIDGEEPEAVAERVQAALNATEEGSRTGSILPGRDAQREAPGVPTNDKSSPPTPSGAATLDVEELQRSARQLDVTLSTMAAIVSVPQSLWDDHCNAALKLIAALPALLSRAEEADRLDLELADAKAGYLRRHNEATDHFERAIEAETKLAASEAREEALREALKPFADLAKTFEGVSVVEVCQPHPGNPAFYIQPLPTSALTRARALLSSEAPNG